MTIEALDLARMHLEQRRFMEAMVVTKKAIQRASADIVSPRLMLARIYAAQGKREDAAATLKTVLGVDPDNTEATEILAALEAK